jgi:hypothetical protein
MSNARPSVVVIGARTIQEIDPQMFKMDREEIDPQRTQRDADKKRRKRSILYADEKD